MPSRRPLIASEVVVEANVLGAASAVCRIGHGSTTSILRASDDRVDRDRREQLRRLAVSKPRRLLWLLGTLAFVAATGVLAACGDDDARPPGAEERAVVERAPVLEHIHGLGVNRAEGRLFIAAHNGLFAAASDDTRPERLADTSRTSWVSPSPVATASSGRPSRGRAGPSGKSRADRVARCRQDWKNVSLLGDADVHVLQHSGNKIYGFEGTQGRRGLWRQRAPLAAPQAARGRLRAGDRSDPLLARRGLTENGLFISTDEGTPGGPCARTSPGCLGGRPVTACSS